MRMSTAMRMHALQRAYTNAIIGGITMFTRLRDSAISQLKGLLETCISS